jgi:hypothetical protein
MSTEPKPEQPSKYVKYPRTAHLPWSPGATDDDKLLRDLSAFEGRRAVATIKKDGENNTLYTDHLHARSLDSRHHPSRDWLRAFHAGMAADIPEGWRVCGEGMFARHSIAYDDLPSYFLGFSVWNADNRCLPWDETLEWFELLGVTPVPVIFDGLFDLDVIKRLHEQLDLTKEEGFVIRVADGFSYSEFRTHVAKYVRAGHVQTDQHWMHGPVVRNGLAE